MEDFHGFIFKANSGFFGKIFSFGRRLLSEPFLNQVLGVASLLYPPAAPIIGAVDRLFEQRSQKGFQKELDGLLNHTGLDKQNVELIKNLVLLFLPGISVLTEGKTNAQKAMLSKEILKMAIAGNRGEFRKYGAASSIEHFFGIKINGLGDKNKVPDHLVNFNIELTILQNKFNGMLERMIVHAQTALLPLLEATERQIEGVLEQGRERGLWDYTLQDYKKGEVKKEVAALLTKEEALEEDFALWGAVVSKMEQIPDSLANFAVEAVYANSRLRPSKRK